MTEQCCLNNWRQLVSISYLLASTIISMTSKMAIVLVTFY